MDININIGKKDQFKLFRLFKGHQVDSRFDNRNSFIIYRLSFNISLLFIYIIQFYITLYPNKITI